VASALGEQQQTSVVKQVWLAGTGIVSERTQMVPVSGGTFSLRDRQGQTSVVKHVCALGHEIVSGYTLMSVAVSKPRSRGRGWPLR
jgi:hypothetical protein